MFADFLTKEFNLCVICILLLLEYLHFEFIYYNRKIVYQQQYLHSKRSCWFQQ